MNTGWWEEFTKYAVEMGSGAIIYIQRFITIGSGIQELIGVIHKTAWRSHRPTFIFFKIRKVDYKMKVKNDNHGVNGGGDDDDDDD
jgi:hypothetical protein